MCKKIDIEDVLNTLGVQDVDSLEVYLNESSPSLVEYTLLELIKYTDDTYFNKAQIQQSFYAGDIEIFIDYDNNCFIEDNVSPAEEYPTLF